MPDELVADFQDRISSTETINIHDLPDMTQYINHRGKYTRPDVRLEKGLYIIPEVFVDMIQSDKVQNKPESVDFHPWAVDRLGREDSHNKVFFGAISTTTFGERESSSFARVSIKPIKQLSALVGELAMFQYMRLLDLPTFQPVGVLVNDRVGHHLITKFAEPVTTMDTIDWSDFDIQERWVHLSTAVDTLVMLHSNMLFHGDLEFKNVGFNENGKSVIVDPELSVSALDLAEEYNSGLADNRTLDNCLIGIKRSMSKDFTDLSTSIRNRLFKGLPDNQRPKNDGHLFKEIKRNVLNHYQQAITDSGSRYSRTLLAAYDVMLHEHKERSRGRM